MLTRAIAVGNWTSIELKIGKMSIDIGRNFHTIIVAWKKYTYRSGSESCPSRGLLFGLLARGHPDSERCDE